MFFYRACGLTIQSEIPLPELVTSLSAQADVTIRRGIVQRPDSSSNYGFRFCCDAEYALFDWQMVGAFVVRGNSEILICPNADVEESLIRLPLLGVVFATLLHRSGFLVLHGSAVVVDEKAVAFIGEKGMGKSTTTMALHKRGYAPISDDIVAISFRDSAAPLVYPSFPQLKLWPDTALSVGENPDALPEVSTGMQKRSYLLSDDFDLTPVPLQGVYVLSFGNLGIQSLDPRKALLQLITHSYCARFEDQLLQGEYGKRHLQQCANLAKQIPVRWLERQVSLEALPEIVQVVEKDVASLGLPL